MSLVTQNGMGLGWWPGIISPQMLLVTGGIGMASAGTMDAATEKIALMGYAYIDGRAASKTVSSSGGQILFNCGTVTFANASTTIRVGIQDVSTTAGPGAQPDGSFDVHDDLVGGTDTITSNVMNTATMSSGTKTINHGQLIAVVLDMTGRGGADSVVVNGVSCNAQIFPQSNSFVSSAWLTTSPNSSPTVIIVADDGTLITLDETWPVQNISTLTFASTNNPDEYINVWTQQTTVKIDALGAVVASATTAGDAVLRLFSDPTGTPSTLESFTILGEQAPQSNRGRWISVPLSAERTLTAGTTYGLGVRATSTGNVVLSDITFNHTNHRAFMRGGSTISRYQRDGDSGAFTNQSTNQIIVGMRISSIDNGSGSGGGARIIGGTVVR